MIKKNICLKKYTTFKIGGRAKYFVNANNIKEIKEAINYAEKNNIPFFVLGNGSNVLINSDDYPGLVIRIVGGEILLANNCVIVDAGVFLSDLIVFCTKNNLSGIEWASGIPATVGGSIYGNAGCFGKSMVDNVIWVDVLNIKTKKIERYKNKECKFGYRESFFKKNPYLIILRAKLKFKKSDSTKIKAEIKKCLDLRRKKQVVGFSAGSVFKNYQFKNQKEKKEFLNNFPELGKFVFNNTIATGILLDSVKLKGLKVGNAMVAPNHANFIINNGSATSKDVLDIIDIAKKKVKQKFKIEIKEEIIFLGFKTIDKKE